MMPRPLWAEMPTTAFGPLARDWIVILPLAAIEQHGPHLPVGVDTYIAEGMTEACIAALPPDLPVTFLPIQEFTKSNEHMRFPGTVTLDWDVVIRQWISIGQCVARAGPRTLVLITSHGGNTAPMQIAARELREREAMRVVTTSWGELGAWRSVYSHDEPMIDIHGGLSETSLMLALRPDLVDMSEAEDFASDQARFADHEKLGWHGAAANMAWLSCDLNPGGAVGEAAGASAELGQQDIRLMVEGFMTLMREIRREISDRDGVG